jgi:outer membrane receptor protein involved in Fe transport
VWEVGGETVVPLLKDFPLIENLEFNGALRYTQYSISGSAITWKAGLNYQPVHDLRFRVTESRDIRAPSLYELFQSTSVTTVSGTDPKTGATYTVPEYTQGNANAQPEIATSNTLGAVYSPSWFQHFSTSVDYYLISINGVLSQSLPIGGGATTAINDCVASNGTSAYCQAIQRDPTTGQITSITNEPINLSETYYRGFDVETSYNFDWSDVYRSLVGRTDLRLLINYQPQAVTVTNPGSPGTNQAGSGVARARFTLSADYNIGPFKAAWQLNYTGSHHPGSAQLTPTYFSNITMPALATDDLSLSYKFKSGGHNLQAFLTINNIFNQSPQLGPSTPATIPGGQDPLGPGSISPLGRYFTGGVRVTF